MPWQRMAPANLDRVLPEGAYLFELMAGLESRALRHVFSAERAAAKIPGLPTDTPLP